MNLCMEKMEQNWEVSEEGRSTKQPGQWEIRLLDGLEWVQGAEGGCIPPAFLSLSVALQPLCAILLNGSKE